MAVEQQIIDVREKYDVLLEFEISINESKYDKMMSLQ